MRTARQPRNTTILKDWQASEQAYLNENVWKLVGGGGGINTEFGINGLKTTLYKIDNQKGPTV